MSTTTSPLALHGGEPAVTLEARDVMTWPIVTEEDEAAVLDVLRRGAMSGIELTKVFEAEFAAYLGMPYALGTCNGTASLLAGMWACEVGAGDEIICPSMTYWACAIPALMLGAAVNFCDIDPRTLCIDPRDIEHRIGPRTKAIVVVHQVGHPCEMDAILPIARKHGVRVIEDVSHAHGGLYKGRRVGTLGDVACMSMMAGKGFAIGEAGMIVTRDRAMYERCVAFGHYERTGWATRFNKADRQITLPELVPYIGLPLGGAKHRMNQTCAAMGRVQLKHYPARMAEIQRAMHRFWDLLEGVPGVHAHRTAPGSDSTMGNWYYARGLYHAEELGGLPAATFCEAVRAEGIKEAHPGCNINLHLHPLFHTGDIFRQGQPTMIAFGQRDVRQGPGSLPVTERIDEFVLGVPWFKKDYPDYIAQCAQAYRKVAEHADLLRKDAR